MIFGQPISPSRNHFMSPLVVGLILVAAVVLFLPNHFALDPGSYLPLHSAMEAFSVLAAMLIFIVGSTAYRERTAANLVILSSGFLVVGLLDFAHTLSYAGMPDWVTPSGPEKAIYFWLAARLIAAFTLLAVVVPWQREFGKGAQALYFAAAVVLAAGVYWTVLYRQSDLPRVMDSGGLTPLKRGLEFLVVGLHAATAWILVRRRQPSPSYDAALMFAAVVTMGLGELFFTAYTSVSDTRNLFGHFYKIGAYYLLYRAIFEYAIRAPYRQVSESERSLRESEERYRLIVETAAEGIWLIDQHGTTVYANQKMADMLGCGGAAQLLGRSLFDFIAAEDRNAALQNLERRSQGIGEQHEFKFRRVDGGEFWTSLAASPIFDQGEYLGALAMVSDITERKLANQKVAKLRYRNELILDSVSDGICGLDANGQIHFINQSAAKMLGYRVEELLGASLHVVAHHSRSGGYPYPGGECPILVALKHGVHSEESRETFWRRDGSSFPVEFSCTPVPASADTNIRMVVSFSDISQRKQAEAALLYSEARFRTIFDSVGDAIFVHDMASGAIVDVNRRACEMYGYSRVELFDVSVGSLSSGIPPYNQENALERMRTAAAGEPQSFEWQAKSRDGRLFWAEVTMRRTELGGEANLLVTVRDITERKAAADLIADLYNNAPNGYHSIDARGLIVHINDTELNWLGYRRAEVVGKMTVQQLLSKSSLASFEENFPSFLARGHVDNLDFELIRKDGSILPVLITATAVKDEDGHFLMSRTVVLDMTERREAEKRLRESEERFRTLFGSIQDAIFVVPFRSDGTLGKFIEVNENACRMLGYSREELLDMSIADVDARDSDVDVSPILKRLRDGESVIFEQTHLTRDGERLQVEVNANPFVLNGALVVMSLVRDITERKRMAREAGEAHQRLRQLSAHLQSVREEEKASIAREIHDDLGGTLTALKMDAYWLTRRLPTDGTALPLLERLESMSQLLDSAVGVTRRIITELRPSVLDDLGLLAALEWQAAQFEKRTAIECRVECIEDKEHLDKQYAIALFRIFQEALTNVARHSGATRVEVLFQHGDKAVSLLVRDNGRGLGKNVDTANRYGIRGMLERANALGGYARIESPPEGGLTINVIFPLHVAPIEETP